MISFPTTLNTGGSNVNLPTLPKRSAADILKNIGLSFTNSIINTAVSRLFAFANNASISGAAIDTSRIPYDRVFNPEVIQKNIFSPAEVGAHPSLRGRPERRNNKNIDVYDRSPLVLSPSVYTLMNTYRYVYSNGVFVALDTADLSQGDSKSGNSGGSGGQNEQDKTVKGDYMFDEYGKKTLTPSLFNPYYGIQRIGPTKNTPLTDTSKVIKSDLPNAKFSTDFTDCSIAKLCELSKQEVSELGQARYKYSDFMFCKDLGMPNNRLITLRKFASPVGDNIMTPGAAMRSNNGAADNVYSTPGDIGRLVAYFDTDDNKLEDIINYSFNASWKQMESQWQQEASQEDSRVSPLGMFWNTTGASYRNAFMQSTTGNNNILDYILSKTRFRRYNDTSSWYENNRTLYNYDEHKIYNPINTIRSTHMYEGNLTFNHEFTLTFNYKLRSYDNINPKAAMLDLLANITAVTYKRGNFWGGRNQIVGAQPNLAGWRKSEAIMKKLEGGNVKGALGDLFGRFFDGENGLDFMGLLGQLANYFQANWSVIKDTAGKVVNSAQKLINNENGDSGDSNTSTGNPDVDKKKQQILTIAKSFAGMGFAKLHDTLGRPQKYAFHSLLSGDNTGIWHVTIGNPRNPILVMGNLIITDTKVSHYGPLGIDDFPTGIKVQITLKHSRPRDMVEIQKMYTRGVNSIYVPMQNSEGLGNENFYHTTLSKSNSGAKTTTGDNPNGNATMYYGDFQFERIKRNKDEIV